MKIIYGTGWHLQLSGVSLPVVSTWLELWLSLEVFTACLPSAFIECLLNAGHSMRRQERIPKKETDVSSRILGSSNTHRF